MVSFRIEGAEGIFLALVMNLALSLYLPAVKSHTVCCEYVQGVFLQLAESISAIGREHFYNWQRVFLQLAESISAIGREYFCNWQRASLKLAEGISAIGREHF